MPQQVLHADMVNSFDNFKF